LSLKVVFGSSTSKAASLHVNLTLLDTSETDTKSPLSRNHLTQAVKGCEWKKSGTIELSTLESELLCEAVFENGTVKVEHCPTVDMISDILTKLLQGELFKKLRDLLLGYSRPQ
jgi:hypothetical protein